MHRLTLRIRLMLLVLAGVMPFLAFNLAGVYSQYRQDQVQVGREALDRARGLAFAVEAELRTRMAALQVLTQSRSLAAGDLAIFRAQAEAVVVGQWPGENIILRREDAQQLMNTAFPSGVPLPARREPENQGRGLRSVSDLYPGGEMDRLTVSISVPVRQDDGSVGLTLEMNPALNAFDKIIQRPNPSEGWRIAVVDRDGRRIARVPADALAVGQPASPALLRAWLGVSEGIVPLTPPDGDPVLLAFSRVQGFGWSVLVAIPTAELTGPAWRSALASVAVGFGLLTLGLALAQLVSRGIVRPITALRHLASAADGVGEPGSAVTGLQETDEVAAVLLADSRRRRAATAELIRHVEALERSNKDLDDFAYIASHDLKEPLRGISNNAKFLEEDYAELLPQAGAKRLSRIGYLTQRMEHLINDLLYFSRLGHQERAVQSTDLNAIIRDIEMMSETMLKERDATIIIPHELPRVCCDKTGITEVFRNLIINAVKYNDAAMKRVEVGFLEKVQSNDGVERRVFYVKDNGMGIAEEFHEDIFRIFKRLNTEDDDKKGTGVGLTFVRKIVERHGGRVWLVSVPGEGTTFYFTIDRGATDDAGAQAAHHSVG
jgi:signal transduction histidine kinase